MLTHALLNVVFIEAFYFTQSGVYGSSYRIMCIFYMEVWLIIINGLSSFLGLLLSCLVFEELIMFCSLFKWKSIELCLLSGSTDMVILWWVKSDNWWCDGKKLFLIIFIWAKHVMLRVLISKSIWIISYIWFSFFVDFCQFIYVSAKFTNDTAY